MNRESHRIEPVDRSRLLHSGVSASRRWLRRWPPLAGLVLSLACAVHPQSGISTRVPPEQGEATLKLANRAIFVFRGTLDGYSAPEREAAAAVRLHSVLGQARSMTVSTQAVPAGIELCLDGRALFVMVPGDLAPGQTLGSAASSAAEALRGALEEMGSLSTPRAVLLAVGEALLGPVGFIVLLWAIRRAKRWLVARSTRLVAQKAEKLRSRHWRAASLRSFVMLARAFLNFISYFLIAFLAYVLLCYELRRFPYTRPWGDLLRAQGVSVLATLGEGVLAGLPGLAVVVLLVLVARMFTQVLSRLFAAAEEGGIELRRFDRATAATTRRLLVILVWVIAAVVAYPYIPGSQSLAFKGVTVFAGLLVSLGSTSIVNQIASGLLLVYTRAFKAGDYVRVGETEGTVMGIGLCVTRIRTPKNEEVHLANNILLGTATKNYTRLAASHGLFLPIKVTIGYVTPWRQVHAMLLAAAARTSGLSRQPEPFVLQNSLGDFYVEYELNVSLERPEQRLAVQSELHSRIQDVFNEHGVQIMSPHYFQDPPKPHIVPPNKWFCPPARATSGEKARALHGKRPHEATFESPDH